MHKLKLVAKPWKDFWVSSAVPVCFTCSRIWMDHAAVVLSFGLGCNCGTHHFACVLTFTLAKGMSSISICVVQHFCVRCCWISPPVASLDSVIQLGLQLRLASSSERLCCHTLFAGLGCSERRCMLVVHRHHVVTTVALLKS